jgi:hypothetical protein
MPIKFQGMKYMEEEDRRRLQLTEDQVRIHTAIIDMPMGSILGFNLGPDASNEDASDITRRYHHPKNKARHGFKLSKKCGYDEEGNYWLTVEKIPVRRRKADR